MQMILDASAIEQLASQVPSTEGVYFVPAFTGLGAPYWNQDARGTIFGLTRGSSKAHIARAALESVGFQVYDVLNAMQKDANIELSMLKVDGGASRNSLLMQIQSNMLHCEVSVPVNKETTAMGAAYLAGLAIGYWTSVDEVEDFIATEKIFKPENSAEENTDWIKGWHRAVNATIAWSGNG
jgi:glycerol kinase